MVAWHSLGEPRGHLLPEKGNKAMDKIKDYLGDGAYVEFINGEIVLTAENGIFATDTIVLGVQELAALDRFRRRKTIPREFAPLEV